MVYNGDVIKEDPGRGEQTCISSCSHPGRYPYAGVGIPILFVQRPLG